MFRSPEGWALVFVPADSMMEYDGSMTPCGWYWRCSCHADGSLIPPEVISRDGWGNLRK